jgi:uncharacterized membrane protein YccC
VTRMGQAARFRDAVVPDWLAEVVRLHRTPVPWATMIRASAATCVPLAVAFAAGQRPLGLLVSMGGLLGTVVDKGGPYQARVKRVASAAVFGGAAGLAIGSLIHGRGWIAVLALVVVAGVSALLSALGDIGSVTGLQLLIYTSFGLGPLGVLRPWWHTAIDFLLGTVWALVLIAPGWLLAPRAAEQRSVAALYRALAAQLGAAGTDSFTEMRRGVTAALNSAYDALLAARSAAAGQDERIMRLMALLNQANLVTEATTALNQEGNRPPQPVIDAVEQVADAIRDGRALEITAPRWGASPAAAALHDALAEAARLMSGKTPPPQVSPAASRSLRDRVDILRDRLGGQFSAAFAVRLMASIGVAAVLSETLALRRSYWVVLTVAIVLKPDFGSVFARAVQRGAGTVLGAVLGAVILTLVPHGPWLLLPFGILAALLPYGQARNYGLLATFLTPLVVVLIDLLVPAGWHLALARLLDTLLGCAVVLLIGYAPWPQSWQAHLPGQFARTIRDVCRYMNEALVTAWATQPGAGTAGAGGAAAARPPGEAPAAGPMPGHQVRTGLAARSRLRRCTYRALSDLRAEFQRTMSEPAPISRRATAWWPALVGLEEVVDAVTATAVAIAGGAPAPSPRAVEQLCATLRAVADMTERGSAPPSAPPLPADEPLRPVRETVCSVLTVLRGQKQPTVTDS